MEVKLLRDAEVAQKSGYLTESKRAWPGQFTEFLSLGLNRNWMQPGFRWKASEVLQSGTEPYVHEGHPNVA